MLDDASLKELLASKELGRKDKLLLIMGWQDARPKSVSEIRDIGWQFGLRAARGWNISDALARGKAEAIRVADGWELTKEGRNRVSNLAGAVYDPPVAKAAIDLRAHLATIRNPDITAFLNEAIACLELQQLRAATVLAWVGAIAVLYDHVVLHHLAAFNTEAVKRDAKWKSARTADDLGRMKEFDFLNAIEAISIIGKNVKQELQNALQFRNSCGHPNSLKIGANRVASHIEILILNVFQKF